MSRIGSPNSTITATSATVASSNNGTTVNTILPGRVSRPQLRCRSTVMPASTRHLSTPPMIGSELGHHGHRVGDQMCPGVMTPTACRWMNDGSWIRMRKGWSVPSLTTYAAYWPRGPSMPA